MRPYLARKLPCHPFPSRWIILLQSSTLLKIMPAMLLTAAMILMLCPANAWCLPHYARKYDVPCDTCHQMNFPKLNYTGESFQNAGYRFSLSEDPVKFNLENALSGLSRLRFSRTVTPDQSKSTGEINAFELFSSAAIGRNLSYYVEYYFIEDGKPLWADYFLNLTAGSDKSNLSLRGGQLVPMLWTRQGTGTRLSISRPEALNGRVTNDNSYRVRDRQKGADLSWYRGNLTLSTGLYQGSGPNVEDSNDYKDLVLQGYYAFDRYGSSIGVYHYDGRETVKPSKGKAFLDNFQRTAVLANWNRGDWELMGAWVGGKNQDSKGKDFYNNGYFLESDVSLGKNLAGFLRYDNFVPDTSHQDKNTNGWTVGVDYSMLDGMKLTGEARFLKVSGKQENSLGVQWLITF